MLDKPSNSHVVIYIYTKKGARELYTPEDGSRLSLEERETTNRALETLALADQTSIADSVTAVWYHNDCWTIKTDYKT